MTNSVSLKKTAVDILNNNQYLTLGTINEDNSPWVTSLAYAFDKKNNLYFMTIPDSRHARNIKRNTKVALTIFDSQQPFGTALGLQVLGEAKELALKQSMPAFKYYFGRKWPFADIEAVKMFKKIFKVYKYRFYQVRLTDVWMNDPRKEFDARVRIRMV